MTDTTAAHDAHAFMRRALDLAQRGWGQTAPNPMVGAVVVRDGRIVGEGYHAAFGDAHAEVVALREAGDQAQGGTLFVTLEPCRHFGKTPPCTDAILATGIKSVVIATLDPTPQSGGGAALLEQSGLHVEIGALAREALELNAPFFYAAEHDLPWTTMKLAVSRDMAIAGEGRTATWLTGPESRAEVHRLRAGQDAIAVGVGTIIADDPQLTIREGPQPRKQPARVIFDRSLRTPLRSKVVLTAREVPTVIVTQNTESAIADLLRDAGVHLIATQDLRDGFRRLRAAGIRALMVEGGAAINRAVFTEKLAHRVIIIQAPVALGPGALPAFESATPEVVQQLEKLRVLDRRSLGPDTMTTYALAET